jgi:hypothetical protein
MKLSNTYKREKYVIATHTLIKQRKKKKLKENPCKCVLQGICNTKYVHKGKKNV